uniref:Uncharacterized protein n=1 Tax=Rhizophora mucronata TaxID=61149 RepID=A0A2P2NWG2_RHIMU
MRIYCIQLKLPPLTTSCHFLTQKRKKNVPYLQENSYSLPA